MRRSTGVKRVKSKSGKIYLYDAKKYRYQHKSTRGATLVGKSGKINRKNVDAYIEAIKKNEGLTEAEKISLVADLEEQVNARHKRAEKLTTTGFEGYQKEDAFDRMFANAGVSTEEIADEYGIPEDALRDPANWSGDIFTYGGRTWVFKFTYRGNLLNEIK